MQKLFRQNWPLVAIAVLLVCGCYSHTGQPLQADHDRWFQAAIEACERGDQPAYKALIDRSEFDDEQIQCHDRSIVDNTTFDAVD